MKNSKPNSFGRLFLGALKRSAIDLSKYVAFGAIGGITMAVALPFIITGWHELQEYDKSLKSFRDAENSIRSAFSTAVENDECYQATGKKVYYHAETYNNLRKRINHAPDYVIENTLLGVLPEFERVSCDLPSPRPQEILNTGSYTDPQLLLNNIKTARRHIDNDHFVLITKTYKP